MLNQKSDLPELRKLVQENDREGIVYFMYISDEPSVSEALGVKEGDGPVLYTEFGEKYTTDVAAMKRYIRGRFGIEPTTS